MCFCVGEYAEYGFDHMVCLSPVVACGTWSLADLSSVSPSSEQTEGLLGNQCLNSW